MDIGMVGLGRMGANMTQRLLGGGHRVVVTDLNPDAVKASASAGAVPADSLADIVSKLSPRRAIWMMVPSGAPVQATIDMLAPLLSKGDVLVDGGNSNYHDSVRRADDLRAKGIEYLDAGTSGGIWGLKEGFCLMVAGSKFDLDLHQVSALWNRGSVVRSWLLELTERAFERDPRLESIKGYVQDSGEGRWTVQEAIDQDVPAPIITLSLMRRVASRQPESFSAKVQAALRNEFGGHAVQQAGKAEP